MISAAQATRRWATVARLGPTGELGSAALGLAVAWGYLGQVPCPGSAAVAASAAAALPALPCPGTTLQHL